MGFGGLTTIATTVNLASAANNSGFVNAPTIQCPECMLSQMIVGSELFEAWHAEDCSHRSENGKKFRVKFIPVEVEWAQL